MKVLSPTARTLLTLCAAPLVLLACHEPVPPAEENVAANESEIVGGTIDTMTKAVVFLLDEQGSACSGTIIAKSGGTAWVLTAAHCQGMDYAIQADDYEDCFGNGNSGCEAVYPVVEDTVHPSYNGDASQGYDFRILEISGAAGAPVIPAATSPDGVSAGSDVIAVGYGATSGGNSSNSLRRRVTEEVSEIYVNPPLLLADQTDGTGSCSGDSGGPILFNGTVVGVTSFGDQNCTQFGGYGRVQAVYNAFIAPIIGQPGGEITCDDCFNSSQQPSGACGGAYDACVNNQDCIDFADCITPCSTDACIQTCIDQHPTGTDLYIAIVDCGCNACSTECAEECGGSSSSSTTNSSSSTSSVGGGGVGGSGAGNGENNGGATNNSSSSESSSSGGDDEGADGGVSSCSTTPTNHSGNGLAALGLVGLIGALRRRQIKR
jgi:MYXO-CTERM domain-containing protein